MKIGIKKYQQGGAMPPEQVPAQGAEMGAEQGGVPAEGGAPEEQPANPSQGGEDPVMQLAQMAMQALQGQDCEAAIAVCQGFVQLVQQMSQGGGEAPAEAPEGEPVYRAGGKLVGRIRK